MIVCHFVWSIDQILNITESDFFMVERHERDNTKAQFPGLWIAINCGSFGHYALNAFYVVCLTCGLDLRTFKSFLLATSTPPQLVDNINYLYFFLSMEGFLLSESSTSGVPPTSSLYANYNSCWWLWLHISYTLKSDITFSIKLSIK